MVTIMVMVVVIIGDGKVEGECDGGCVGDVDDGGDSDDHNNVKS